MILRSIYYALCALVLAGLVHIAIVLLIPSYGTKDAYAQLSRDFPMLAFRQMRMAPEQRHRDHAVQDAIADEFEPLVVGVAEAAMRQGRLQQLAIAKDMSQ